MEITLDSALQHGYTHHCLGGLCRLAGANRMGACGPLPAVLPGSLTPKSEQALDTMIKLIALAALLSLAAGCTSLYGDPDEDVYGRQHRLEYSQKSRAIQELVGRVQHDPGVAKFYGDTLDLAETRGHDLPVILVGDIEDNTGSGESDYAATAQIRDELKAELRATGRFDVIDLATRQRMWELVSKDADSGASGENVQSHGKYLPGDLVLEGELRRDRASGNRGGLVYYHFLNLRLLNPQTGLEVWQGSARFRKDWPR